FSRSSGRRAVTYCFAHVPFVLGAAFLALEIREFAGMMARGATPQTSAFLSAFFTLVGCHGLHVTAGLIWLAVMMAQVAIKGFRPTVDRRLLCFALFWHALDIIWLWLFTAVYLMDRRTLRSRAWRRFDFWQGGKDGRVGRRDLHDWTGPCRDPHGHLVLGGQHLAALGARRAHGPCRARHRPDGRSPGLLPAHHHRSGQHQQRFGAGVRRAHRVPGRRRTALDHERSEHQPDAASRADESDAALNGLGDRPRSATTRHKSGTPHCPLMGWS